MNPSRTRAALLLGLAALALTAGTNRAVGDDPATLKSDAKAGRLLDQVIAAYKALPAYGDQGEFVLATTIDGHAETRKSPLRLTLVRPNKLSLDTRLARIVSDGDRLTTVVKPLKTYTEAPAPRVVTFDTVFTGGAVGSAVFGGPSAPMMGIVLNFLVGDDPDKALLDLGDTLTAADDRVLDGAPCQVLKLASDGGGLAFHLLIDPKTHLCRAIELSFDPKALADAFGDAKSVKIDTFRWTAGAVSTEPPAESAFAFDPPRDFHKMETLASADAKDANEETFKVHSLVGKPAPDVSLTVLDGAGKTRTLSRNDLAGKVVLIDFWATWCGPCLAELPEIQKLVETYARDKKDVVILALSQDNDPRDPAEVRKLIEETLKKKSITLAGAAVGKVGLDPSNAVGEAFKIEAFPTVVLIDARGVVRSAHVGFNPDAGRVLNAEIDALLAGKPIGEKKADETK